MKEKIVSTALSHVSLNALSAWQRQAHRKTRWIAMCDRAACRPRWSSRSTCENSCQFFSGISSFETHWHSWVYTRLATTKFLCFGAVGFASSLKSSGPLDRVWNLDASAPSVPAAKV